MLSLSGRLDGGINKAHDANLSHMNSRRGHSHMHIARLHYVAECLHTSGRCGKLSHHGLPLMSPCLSHVHHSTDILAHICFHLWRRCIIYVLCSQADVSYNGILERQNAEVIHQLHKYHHKPVVDRLIYQPLERLLQQHE